MVKLVNPKALLICGRPVSRLVAWTTSGAQWAISTINSIVTPQARDNFMRSKRYQKLVSKIDKTKEYPIEEAIALVKETGQTKFDSSVEIHLRLGIDAKKGEQAVRGSLILPHGTGKSKRVAVFAEDEKVAEDAGADVVGDEELIKQIKASGKVDFDTALATPAMIKKLAGVAKVLGPKGLMPSPKAGSLVEAKDMAKAVEEIKKGKINFRNDDSGNIHESIGKVSWPDNKLKENFEAFIQAVNKARPSTVKGSYIKSIYLTSTMGPAIKLEVE